MANSKLLPGERVLMSSDKNILTLTNFRVRLNKKATGASKFISITLDCVASCGLVTRAKPLLLIIAAICALIGITQNKEDVRYILLLGAVILVVIYFFTRSAVIAISSNGGERIAAPVIGMSRENILEFLEAVGEARLKFIGKLGQ
jgi:hypothetical protein